MSVLSRRDALGVLGCGLLAACGRSGAVKVGSKNFSEEYFLGELYAQILEKHGLRVERKLDLGSIQVAMAALQRGEIDLYPEYTGTALLVQLKLPPSSDAAFIFQTVKREYAQRYRLEWLRPAPFNDTQALASTKEIARRFDLRTLSDVSRAAPQLRLAVGPEFRARPDGLPGLQRAYGGFRFKEIREVDIGLRYQAILDRRADVTVAFSTDGPILQFDLFVYADDRHFFPPYQAAPVVRLDALQRFPAIRTALDAIAPALTDDAVRRANFAIDGPSKREPADVAREFIAAQHLG